MLRRLLNIASIVCLVLCVAWMSLWLRSYLQVENILISFGSQSCLVVSGRGEFCLSGMMKRPAIDYSINWKSMPYPIAGPRTTLLNFGFSYFPTGVVLMLPHWCLMLASGTLAMIF